jgi:hypothetical protein
MSTWISRSLAVALCAGLLAGCDEATGLPFAAELSSLTESSGRSRLAEVDLAGGAVTLSAPEGYCFDKRSLKRTGGRGFAVMARCDTLGVRGFFGAHDLAIVTVTTAPRPEGVTAAPGLDALEATGGGAPVLSRQRRDGLSLIRFGDGAPPMDGVSATHWRGAFALNGQLVGVALYAPEGSDALKDSGAALLSDLTRRTRKASNTAASLDASALSE